MQTSCSPALNSSKRRKVGGEGEGGGDRGVGVDAANAHGEGDVLRFTAMRDVGNGEGGEAGDADAGAGCVRWESKALSLGSRQEVFVLALFVFLRVGVRVYICMCKLLSCVWKHAFGSCMRPIALRLRFGSPHEQGPKQPKLKFALFHARKDLVSDSMRVWNAISSAPGVCVRQL